MPGEMIQSTRCCFGDTRRHRRCLRLRPEPLLGRGAGMRRQPTTCRQSRTWSTRCLLGRRQSELEGRGPACLAEAAGVLLLFFDRSVFINGFHVIAWTRIHQSQADSTSAEAARKGFPFTALSASQTCGTAAGHRRRQTPLEPYSPA